MGNPKRHRQEVRALVSEWNDLVEKNERNTFRQEQIMRRLQAIGAWQDVPVGYAVTRRGRASSVSGQLSSKPDGRLS
jgi:hypothetical protein